MEHVDDPAGSEQFRRFVVEWLLDVPRVSR
jgi:hypothetical protein